MAKVEKNLRKSLLLTEYFSFLNKFGSILSYISGAQKYLTPLCPENDGVYTGNFAMPGQASTLLINTGSAAGDSSI